MDRDIGTLASMKSDGLILNVGAGNKKIISNSVSLDFPKWNAEADQIPFKDSSVDGIHCYHFLEHIENVVGVLLEFQRVLNHGGVLNIVVPYYNSQMQAHDLDHKNSFCEDTWRILFHNEYYNKNKIVWKFFVNLNIIIGVKERNLCLMTQLIKEE